MTIGGLVKFSLIDYPGKSCAVIFTRGCNFRCPFCHNPELVLPEKYSPEIPVSEVLDFLKSREGKLDAVTITGGEPTMHSDLPDFIKKLKDMSFFVKLDSNGSNPEMLKNLIEQKLVDYIAMDVKSTFENYEKAAGVPVDIDKIKKSINLIKNSGLSHEFRTTVVRSIVSLDDLKKIAENVRGAQNYFLQKFIFAGKLNDENFKEEISYSDEELQKIIDEISTFVEHCGIR